ARGRGRGPAGAAAGARPGAGSARQRGPGGDLPGGPGRGAGAGALALQPHREAARPGGAGGAAPGPRGRNDGEHAARGHARGAGRCYTSGVTHDAMKNGNGKERRQHERLPIMDGVLEPIDLRFEGTGKSGPVSIPAILTNISVGGMSLVTFSEPQKANLFEMDLHLPGLHHMPVEAKITWMNAKGQTYAVGMAFVKIRKKDMECLSRMAQDYSDCEKRISLGLPEACVP